MKFTNFHISNFRGVNSEDINLDDSSGRGNVLTLVGLNESGKTTILDAIQFFQKNTVPNDQRFKLIPKKHGSLFTGAISVTATLELDAKDEKKIKDFAAKEVFFKLNPKFNIKNVKITKSYRYERAEYKRESISYEFKAVGVGTRTANKKFVSLEQDDTKHSKIGKYIYENLCPKILYYENFLFNIPTRIYLETFDKEPKGQDTYRQVLQDVLHSIDEGLDLSEDVLKKLKSGTDESMSALTQTLNLMSVAITEEIVSSWGDIFDDDWQGKRILVVPGIERIEEQKDIPASGTTPAKKELVSREVHYLQFKLEEGHKPFEISERSLGFRWFFAFLMFTRFRLSRISDPGETLFLLDEPASNLHSSAQQKLTKVFQTLTSQKLNPAKLVFSTHSHHLVRSEWLETAYIVRNTALDYENSGLSFKEIDTEITATPYKKFVVSHPDKKSYFQPILDSLDFKPSELEMVPRVTIVEGKNDFYSFKYMNQVIFKDKYDIKLYPGNGAKKNGPVIRLYEAWGADYIVLCDSDYTGSSAKQHYVENIGDFVEAKMFDLSDVVESWKNYTTESMFHPTDQMKIINTIAPKQTGFSKKLFNEGLKNLLLQNQAIGLTATTAKKFEKLFEFISGKLV